MQMLRNTIAVVGLVSFAAVVGAAEPDRALQLNITSQPVGDALNEFARQSGLQVVMDPAEAQGVRVQELVGEFTARTALEKLLANTGLRFEYLNERTVAVRGLKATQGKTSLGIGLSRRGEVMRLAQADASQTYAAPAAVVDGVSGEGKVEGEVVVQGAKRKFAPTESTAATKIPMDVIDTPQSLSVLSSELMSIVGAKNLSKALAWTPGVTDTTQDMSLWNQASVRGFSLSDFNSFKINGLAFTGVAIPFDANMIESVEVVRGPAAIIYGESDYGGTVNVRLKKAAAKPRFTGELGADVHGGYRFTADVTGAITEDGRLRGRLGLSYDYGQSEQRLAYTRGTSVTPSLSWDISEKDTLDLNGIFMNRPLRWSIGFGLTEDLKLPEVSKKAFLGADFNLSTTDVKLGFAQWTHRFNDRWTLATSGMVDQLAYDWNHAYIIGPIAENGDVSLLHEAYLQTVTDYAGDVTLTGNFTALGRTHTLALSASKRRSTNDYANLQGGDAGVINVYDPDPFSLTPAFSHLPTDWENQRPTIPVAFDAESDRQSQGISAILLLHPVERTTVLMGLRQTDYQFSWCGYYDRSHCYTNPSRFTDQAINKRLGVVYEVIDDVNLYASYSDGTIFSAFGRVNQKEDSGHALPPETGTQWEVGAKAALLGSKLTVASAIFQIDRQNIAVHDPTAPPQLPVSILLDGQKHRGFEFEAIGEPIPGWNVIASYSYLDVKINLCVEVDGLCTDPFGWNGKQRANSPKNMFKLYSTYQLLGGPWRGLSFGGGLIHASTREATNDGVFTFPAYTRFDARLGYDAQEHVSYSLNFINVTDADIYVSNWEYQFGGIDYQDRRTVMFSVNFKY